MLAMDGRQQLLLFVLLLLAIALLLLLLTSTPINALLFGAILLAALWITRSVWAPSESTRSKVAAASLATISAIAAGYFKLEIKIRHEAIVSTAKALGFNSVLVPAALDWTVGAVLLFALSGIIAVNYLNRASPTAGKRRTPLHPLLQEKSFADQLKGFCRDLGVELTNIDRDTSWSEGWFVPVDAEVEIVSNGRPVRRLRDMLTAIRNNSRDRLFIVLGQPGSGKSVALRMLCKRLLGEVTAKKGKVPLYINLKEWVPVHPWTPTSPPTSKELRDFVVLNLTQRLDIYGAEFVEKHFDRMLDNGAFFVVFDSFDEIPALLDMDESSWLVENLSNIFQKFFFGSADSRGILASRDFRRPRIAKAEKICTLQIRPFSELKIETSFRKSLVGSELTRRLFKERNDLIPLARNPFTAGLIIDFLKQRNSLPSNQAEIYDNCIRTRLSRAEKLKSSGVTADEAIALATEIAGVMFRAPDVGLEIGVPALQKALPLLLTPEHKQSHEQYIAKVIDVLIAARIGRKSKEIGLGRFSFVHRRFNEYFFVCHLLNQGAAPSLEAIPLDSKWRDALVLYAQLCSKEEAEQIARYCWQEMQSATLARGSDRGRYLRHVHCLRFLSDAFHGRAEALVSFVDDLFAHISSTIGTNLSLLVSKIAVEAVGLLRAEQIEAVIRDALSLGSPLISETAFNACRFIPRLSLPLEMRFGYFLSSIRASEVLARFQEIRFSLELSPGMKRLRTFWWWRRVDVYMFVLLSALIFALDLPTVALALIFLGLGRGALSSQNVVDADSKFRDFESVQQTTGVPPPEHIRRERNIPRGFLTSVRIPPLPTINWSVIPPLWSLTPFRASLIVACVGSALLSWGMEYFTPSSFDAARSSFDASNQAVSGYVLPWLNTGSVKTDIVLGFALFPWYTIMLWGPNSLRIIKSALRGMVNHWRRTLMVLLGGGVFIGGFVLLGTWMGPIGDKIALIFDLVAYGGLAVFLFAWILILALKSTVRRVWFGFTDAAVRRQSLVVDPLTRPKIEDTLTHLALVQSRIAYLQEVYNSGLKPTGEWFNGYPPKFGGDESDDFLARLEERWLVE